MTDGHLALMNVITLHNKPTKREQILEAAEKLFFAKGVHQVSMSSIAKEANIAKGTLYLYFNSKEELYRAILFKAFVLLEKYFQKVLNEKEEGLDQALAFVDAYLLFALQEPNFFEGILHYQNDSFNFKKLADEPENAKVVQKGADLMRQFIQTIEKGKNDGSIQKHIDSVETAFVIWGQLTGVLQIVKKKMDLVNIVQPVQQQQLLNTQVNAIKSYLANQSFT